MSSAEDVHGLLARGEFAGAEAAARGALGARPRDAGLNNLMAVALLNQGKQQEAVPFLERALEANRNDAAVLINLGRTLGALSRLDEALPRFERAAELAPSRVEAWEGLAQVLRMKDRYTEAAEKARRGLNVKPDDAGLAALYCGLLMHLARVPEAVAFSRTFLARWPHPAVAAAHASAMTYWVDGPPAEVFQAQVYFARMLGVPAAAPHENDSDPERPLRVGVLSNELRQHAVATFLEPWLIGHDRGAVRVHCYSTATLEDAVTERLKPAVEGWAMVAHESDAAVARRIRADGIDVLLETTGITDGQRLGVMALRPAPVQGTLIGYLNTTGLSAIGHRIVDSAMQPAGVERFSVEKLVRVDPTCWCYRAPENAPEAQAPPCLRGEDENTGGREGGITFGSFNSSPKINDRVIALWARVLAAVPGSRLLLKAYDFADEPLRADIAGRFARLGVEPGRVEIEGPTHGLGAFLANYHRIDIGLDPFPFNGTTTTLDALWMGVPVVTLAGQMTAGRTGVSILSALSMPELIAAGEDEYVRIATGLAGDPARLAEVRRTLRARLAGSVLCDGAGFARRMDGAIRGMWREWCAGRRGG